MSEPTRRGAGRRGEPATGPRAPAGYSGTPLLKKLGIKPGVRMWLRGAPPHYAELLGPLPEGARIADGDEVEFVHLFATRERELVEGFEAAKARLVPDGMVWASWPKKASGVETELDGNRVRALGLAAGLVDVKVCAVDETWSGYKFVCRLADRPG